MDHDFYPLLPDIVKSAHLRAADYWKQYQESLENPEQFWGEQAKQFISWFHPWEHVLTGELRQGDVRWYQGASLNAAYNCLDRHLPARADQIAIIWEGNDPLSTRQLTYRELYEEVCGLASVLKQRGIKKGDSVCIYLPMVPEAAVAMLACARIGAVHSVVFAGFSAEALKTRLLDANCQLIITADQGWRGQHTVQLKNQVDEALSDCPCVHTVIVVERQRGSVSWQIGRDVNYHEALAQAALSCPPVAMDASDPLFILYTSGSTGKPKGIVHSTGGYLVYAAITFKYIFDYHEQDIHWCTADVGWITGHSYVVYGPLLNGATTLMFEGVPHYPTFARYWQIIDKYQVNIFYTAPTAIRALRREGEAWLANSSRQSLRILGSVGEPINPEAWEWYYQVVGQGRCPIVDTWWQTETGGIMISPLPGATPLKSGSAAWPFFGISPAVVDEAGQAVERGQMGKLIITRAWPGMMQSIYGDHEKFIQTYLSEYPGAYLTGDQAYQDADGYYWMTGRSDDVIKVSGHRIGTQELESALICHPAVSEAAVVAVADAIRGHGIYAFVTLKTNLSPSAQLHDEIINTVRKNISAIAAPQYIQFAEALPKTRSGKIMRRILRKIANNELDGLDDLSTLADPSVIDELIQKRLKPE